MKPTKILGCIFVLLFAVVAGLIAYVLGNINQIVKETIETVGPEITQTHVGIRDVDIKLLKGTGQLSHFVVGNPAGYSDGYILKWDVIDLEIDPKTIRSDVVVIKNITVKGMAINVEQKGISTNIQALLNSVSGKPDDSKRKSSKAKKSSGQSSAEQKDAAKDAAKDDGVKLVLEHIQFSASTIELSSQWGAYTLSLPDFEILDVGSKEEGLTPKELGNAVLKPLLELIEKEVGSQLKMVAKEKLKQAKERLKEEAANQKEKLKSKFKDGKHALEEKTDKLKDKLQEKLDAKDIENSLRKLFR